VDSIPCCVLVQMSVLLPQRKIPISGYFYFLMEKAKDDLQIQLDIANIKKDVGYLTTQVVKQDGKQDKIIERLDKMSYVHSGDFDKHKIDVAKEIADIKEEMAAARPAIKLYNNINGRWTQVLISGIIIAVIVAVSGNISKFIGGV